MKRKLPIVSFVATIVTMIIGILALIGWFTHNHYLWSIAPSAVNMKFNTALGFVLSSIVLLLNYFPGKTKMLHFASILLSVMVSLIGLLTLAQYISGINMGFDKLFVRDELPTTAVYYAGRMSALSAINFLLIGVGLLLLNKEKTAAYHFFYLSGIVFTSLLMLIGFNFVSDIPAFIRITTHAALSYVTLSIAIWFAQPMLQKKISFERKLFTGFTAVIILIVIISVISSYYRDKVISASKWVNHTNKVLSESEQILSLATEIESGGRGYIISGDSNYLEYYTIAKNAVFGHVEKLKELTQDNATQQVNIDSLLALVRKRIAFSQQCIQLRNEKGFDQANKLMATLMGKFYTDHIRNLTSVIQQAENNLLRLRQKETDNSIASFNLAFYIFLSSIFILLITIFFAILKNTTIRKKAEENIRFKAELLNTIGQAVIATDMDGTINFWNKAAAEIYGWTSDEAIGKNGVGLIQAKQTKEQTIEIMQQLSQGHSWSGEFMVQRKDGHTFPVFVNNAPTYDQHHKLSGIIGVSSDITETKNSERQIRDSEQRYRTLFEQNLAGFYQTTMDGVILNCNDAFAKMLKYKSRKELLLRNATELYFSSAERNEFITDVVNQKKLYSNEGVLKCKDGSPLYFLENISLGKDTITGEAFLDGILIDITERKLAELQLKEINERFINVSKATFDAIWDWDLLSETIYWGEGYHTLFGYNLQEVKPDITSWTDHIHPDDIDRVVKGVYELIGGTQLNWVEEYRYLKADQTYAYVTDKGFLIRDEQGKAVRMVGAMQDITGKKALEDLLDKASNMARIGSWEINLIEGTVYWSRITREIHEVEPGFIPGLATGINFYKEGESSDLINQKVQDCIETGTPWDVETQIITARGNEKWIRSIGEGEITNDKCVRIYGSLQDIDIRKRAELRVIEAFEEKNTILESIGDAFFTADKNWNVTYWNNQAVKMLRIPKHEILGRHLWEVFSDSIDSESYRKYHEAIETRQVVHFEDYFDPLAKWFSISAYPSVTGLSVYFKDVTDRKLYEFRLIELNENLQKHAKELAVSNAELEQFAYVASHDLQEPLRMVTSFLTQLEKKYGNVIDDKGKQYIAFAVDGAKRMRQIILDLLEFSRVGRTEDQKEELDLNELIKEIQILFRKQIEEKKAVIRVCDLPVINAYKAPLRQIFQNLVSNALKYTGADTVAQIQITARESETHWQFAVADNGIGISGEYFDRIFIIFQRLHNKDEFSGTGMGLAITKKIIENLGGKIWVESEEGKGSTFYFTLLKQH